MPDPLPIVPDSSSQKHLSLPHLLLLTVAVAAMIVVLWWSKQSDRAGEQNPSTTSTTKTPTGQKQTFTTPPQPTVTQKSPAEAKAYLKATLSPADYNRLFGTSTKP